MNGRIVGAYIHYDRKKRRREERGGEDQANRLATNTIIPKILSEFPYVSDTPRSHAGMRYCPAHAHTFDPSAIVISNNIKRRRRNAHHTPVFLIAMRLPALVLALVVTVRGSQARWAVNTDKNDQENDAVESYFEKLIPVINDTILHQNSGPSIGADVKTRPLCVCQGDIC